MPNLAIRILSRKTDNITNDHNTKKNHNYNLQG